MLKATGIELSYGASLCLRGVDLVAEPGTITCVLGRNGVGKSSLMRAIMGLERIRAGSIVWEGRDISTAPPAERARAGIGYVPQGREIFPFLTVQENLETALAAVPRGSRVSDEVFEMFPILKQVLRRRGYALLRLYTNEKMVENVAMYPRLGFTETHRGSEAGHRRVYFEKRLDALP